MFTFKQSLIVLCAGAGLVTSSFCATLPAASPAEPTESVAAPSEAAAEGGLATEQRQVAERFRELEKLLLRMAELTAPTDPRRAALLRQAVAQSKERDIDHQFEQLVDLLKQERLSVVVKNQAEVQQDLAKLLELLLSEDRNKNIASEKARIREYLKRVNKIIKEQKGLQGETARDGDAQKIADRQGELSDKTAELADDIEKNEGKKPASEDASKSDDKSDDKSPDKEKQDSDKQKSPEKPPADGEDKKQDGPPGDSQENEGKPGDQGPQDKGPKDKTPKDKSPKDAGEPSPDQGEQSGETGEPSDQAPSDNPAQKKLKQAQQRMKEAEQKLEEAKRREAADKQAEAVKELEQAKADLEEILRQLREEEMSRTLAMLEARFRKMLDQQVEVYDGTKRLDRVAETERDRDDEIEAGRLSRKEAQIAGEADKALSVLREEGSAVAFPEAVMEIRDDMEQVVARLAQAKVGEITQGVETDIIVALEEMIDSLKKAQKEMQNKNKPGEPSEGVGESESPLVDTLSELKMIRALQMRVNVRTKRYGELTNTEQADKPELLEALKGLAQREQRIHKVTRDIVVGRNR